MKPATFTIKQLAEANGLSCDTVERRIRRKEIDLKPFRVGLVRCPQEFDALKASPVLTAAGYRVPRVD